MDFLLAIPDSIWVLLMVVCAFGCGVYADINKGISGAFTVGLIFSWLMWL